jgi:hypothetical protein
VHFQRHPGLLFVSPMRHVLPLGPMPSWAQLPVSGKLSCDLRNWTTADEGRGVTKLTVTIVVIMFELTGALTYILPTMVSRSLSSLVAKTRAKFVDCPACDQSRQRFVRRGWDRR